MEMSSSSLEDESSHVQDEGWRQVSSTFAVVTKNPAEATNFGPETGNILQGKSQKTTGNCQTFYNCKSFVFWEKKLKIVLITKPVSGAFPNLCNIEIIQSFKLVDTDLQLGQESLPDKLVLMLSSIQAMGLMDTDWVQQERDCDL